MRRFLVHTSKGRFRIEGLVQAVGGDLLVCLWGGTPHIGAVGIAQPRPSLKDSEEWSATTSNFTFPGHKEDALVKEISEALAAGLRRNVVVTAGMHWDKISPREIKIIENLCRRISKQILKKSFALI